MLQNCKWLWLRLMQTYICKLSSKNLTFRKIKSRSPKPFYCMWPKLTGKLTCRCGAAGREQSCNKAEMGRYNPTWTGTQPSKALSEWFVSCAQNSPTLHKHPELENSTNTSINTIQPFLRILNVSYETHYCLQTIHTLLRRVIAASRMSLDGGSAVW